MWLTIRTILIFLLLLCVSAQIKSATPTPTPTPIAQEVFFKVPAIHNGFTTPNISQTIINSLSIPGFSSEAFHYYNSTNDYFYVFAVIPSSINIYAPQYDALEGLDSTEEAEYMYQITNTAQEVSYYNNPGTRPQPTAIPDPVVPLPTVLPQ